MSREEVIKKIKKLQRLEINAKEINSLGEANNAAQRIQHLLMQYNLSLEEIDKHSDEPGPTGVDIQYVDYSNQFKKAEGLWIGTLAAYIATNNLCEIVLSRGRPAYWIIGSKENRETVVFIVDQLVAKFRQLEKISWSTYGASGYIKRNKYRRDFLKGASIGIYNKLCEQSRAMQQENNQVQALVVMNKDKLAKVKDEHFGNGLKKGRARSYENNSAFQDGVTKGQNTSISPGLNRGSEKSKQLR